MTTFGMTREIWDTIGKEIEAAQKSVKRARKLLAHEDDENNLLDLTLHVALDNLEDAEMDLTEDMIAA